MENITQSVETMILAGGAGKRLWPLTEHQSKPAVPFGAKYRIIDFVLSNCKNSGMGINKISVLPQHNSYSLIKHLSFAWQILNIRNDEYLRILPPQMKPGEKLYQGTAHAVYQNIYSLKKEKPKYVLILSGDQIYRMDYRKLLLFHKEKDAILTVASIESDKETAQRSGVLEVDKNQRIIDFQEKPRNPRSMLKKENKFLISMGIYVFNTRKLIEVLEKDASDEESVHDFGRNIIPKVLSREEKVFSFSFYEENNQPGYWRDVGTIDSYFETSMELPKNNPPFNLYDQNWKWRTFERELPPSKINQAEIKESIISEGCIIEGAQITNSIISPAVKIKKGTKIKDSIIMEEVEIGENSVIERAIIDKENIIPANSVIKFGLINYKEKFETTASGIIVIPKKEPKWED